MSYHAVAVNKPTNLLGLRCPNFGNNATNATSETHWEVNHRYKETPENPGFFCTFAKLFRLGQKCHAIFRFPLLMRFQAKPSFLAKSSRKAIGIGKGNIQDKKAMSTLTES